MGSAEQIEGQIPDAPGDIASRQRIGLLRIPRGAWVRLPTFSPRHRRLATIHEEGLQLWDLDDRAWSPRHAPWGNRSLTRDEWQRLIGSAREFEEVCPDAVARPTA
jgi:hypothetical protein